MSVPIFPLTSLQRPMFLVNSRSGLVTVALLGLLRKELTYSGHPIFLSYGANLPSSLTRVISSTLGYSPHLPVLVCGTVTQKTSYGAFLGKSLRLVYPLRVPITPPLDKSRVQAWTLYSVTRPIAASASLFRSASFWWCLNFNRLPIAYPRTTRG